MLIHLIETKRRLGWHLGSTVWSAATHAMVIAAVVVRAVREPSPEAKPQREVVYLLPTLPSSPSHSSADRLAFSTPSSGFEASHAGLDLGPSSRRGGAATPSNVARTAPSEAVDDSLHRPGNAVYVEAELDRPVERDPSSAGPAYPPELQLLRIEGGVVAEWVVDTLGAVDTTTFRVVTATHDPFSAAVRAVLPQMRFRPAEFVGHRVRQLVHQEFVFRLLYAPADSSRGPQPR